MNRPLLIALVLVVPVFAGCFSQPEDLPAAAPVAANAQEAGATQGPAPSAAKSAYQVEAAEPGAAPLTAYPVPFETNPPKAPFVTEFSGEFQPYQCLPTGGGLPLGGLGLARGTQWFDVAEAFQTGDVFSYDVSMRFTNTDQSWAELHLFHRFDDVNGYWNEPTSDGRGEVVLNFTGQGYIVNDEFDAVVGVDCWYGSMSQPIPFTITVAFTFAEGAVPSQVPVLLKVPEGATRLLVTGVALDGARPVTSHFRVFAPDDSVVCECALNSAQSVSVVELDEAGDHVVLVDHTEGGFVAFALDAPSEGPLRALGTRFERFDLPGSDGGSLDETVQIEFPSTPLGAWAWVLAPGEPFADPGNAGGGHNVRITLSNAIGDVVRVSMVSYLTFHATAPGFFGTNDWYAVPLDGEWEFYSDHHAYMPGGHTVTVKADQIRGRAVLWATFYDRES